MNNEPVIISFSAHVDYFATLRLVIASLAARSQFDVDQIEDLLTAVYEVSTKVVAYAKSGSRLTVFLSPGDTFVVRISAPSAPEFRLPPSYKSNYLIKELVDDVSTIFEQGQELCIELKLGRRSGD